VEFSAESGHLASAQGTSPQEELVIAGTIASDRGLHGPCGAKVRRFFSRSAGFGTARPPFDRLAAVTLPDRGAA